MKITVWKAEAWSPVLGLLFMMQVGSTFRCRDLGERSCFCSTSSLKAFRFMIVEVFLPCTDGPAVLLPFIAILVLDSAKTGLSGHICETSKQSIGLITRCVSSIFPISSPIRPWCMEPWRLWAIKVLRCNCCLGNTVYKVQDDSLPLFA